MFENKKKTTPYLKTWQCTLCPSMETHFKAYNLSNKTIFISSFGEIELQNI